MSPEREPRPQESSNAVIVYMVSVYLLLIAFFVILHTVSKKEEVRAAAVVGSLRVTFQRPEGRTEDLPQDSGKPRFSGPNEDFRDHVIGLFGSFINSSRYSQTEGGNVLRISVDPEAIFYSGTSTLRADRIDLVRRLADMIANPQPYLRNSIDIWMQRPVMEADGAGKTLAVRRAGVLARDLEANGVDPKGIGIGVTRGAGDQIYMTFTSTPIAPPGGGNE